MIRPIRRWAWRSGAVRNMRDLGGYACANGMTKFGVVLRSDMPYGMTDEERLQLIEYGLTDVIDLRSLGERERFKNDFTDAEGVTVHTITIEHTEDEFQFSPSNYKCMGEMYIDMADTNAIQYADMVRVVAESSGTCLVHCMAGKDRTGIVCALMLLAVGVDEVDVVSDYQISETHQHREDNERYITSNPDFPRYLIKSEPDNMWMLIEHLNSKYGGAVSFLKRSGLTDETLEKLRARLVERF